MDFDWTPELLALAAEAREVGRKATEGRWFKEDSWIAQADRAFSEELAARGWIGMTWPTEFGGGGRSDLERFVVYEALISEGAPIANSWFADRQMGPTLLQFGTDEQRARWLPGIIDGRSMWCIGMSEPDAGSDVASLRTSAVRDGDEYVVNGQKIWNSGGAHAEWCYLIARTDPDAPKHKGLSEFIVDMSSPGITVKPIRDMTDDEHFCEIYFDDVRVPAENLVGTPNNSFKQVMRQMEHERGGIDRLVSNERLYRDCLEHLRGVDGLDDPLVRQEIAEIEIRYRIGRLLVLRETLRQAPAGFSAATKTFGTEFEIRVAEFCGRVLGAHACLADEGLRRRVSRNLCYAPGYTIMGGTTEILRNILGDRVRAFPADHDRLARCDVDPDPMTLRVVHVVGKGRSGSTLLDDLLGTVPGVASLGELRQVWSRGFVDGYRCACGAEVARCPVWRPAIERAIGDPTPSRLAEVDRLQSRVQSWPRVPGLVRSGPSSIDRDLGALMGRLYGALAERLDATTLVDSSKWPLPPGSFGVVPGVETWILHLVRDPRAVAHSYRRRKGGDGQPELPRFGALHTAASWTARNLTAELSRRPVPASRFRRLRYEDLASSPRATIVDLGRWLGVEGADAGFVDDNTVRLGSAHLVGGNPRRLDRADVTVRPDDEWSTRGDRGQRVVGALTAPLRGRYGYRTARSDAAGTSGVGP